MMDLKETSEHQWLQQLIGEWTFTGKMMMPPTPESDDKPGTAESSGTESVRALGKFWVIASTSGTMPCSGDMMQGVIQIGFDHALNRFRGSWIGSPMSKMYIYDGYLDDKRRILTLESTGPSFTDPTKETLYRDIIEIVDANNRLFYSQVRNDDNSWTEFLRCEYKRA